LNYEIYGRNACPFGGKSQAAGGRDEIKIMRQKTGAGWPAQSRRNKNTVEHAKTPVVFGRHNAGGGKGIGDFAGR
jgi:hypothetical protein